MTRLIRQYKFESDFNKIGDFLSRHFKLGNEDGNWIQPAWEYMHFHPGLDRSALDKIGIWEDGGEIIGIVNYESRLGEAFFQFHPDCRSIFKEMLDYAERNLVGTDPKGKKYLSVFVNENHEEFLSFVKQHGYLVQVDENRSMAGLPISASLPQANLPKGFLLSSLAEDCNWKKVNEVLWRGFDHPGDAPASVSDFEERRRMFDTPSARRVLKIIVKAPDGNYASLCGFFYEPVNRFAYIEPMATDPDYRRLGLGKAAVLEGLKRCESFGARESYVWNDLPFYRALGFKVVSTTLCWKKEF